MNVLKTSLLLFFILSTLNSKEFLTKTQKEYIKNNKILTIYVEPNIKYYSQIYGNHLSGYLLEYLGMLERKLNIKFDIKTNMSNAQALKNLENESISLAILPTSKTSKNDRYIFSQISLGVLQPAMLIRDIYQIAPKVNEATEFSVVISNNHKDLFDNNEEFLELEYALNNIEAIDKIRNQNADFAIGFNEIFEANISNFFSNQLKIIPIYNNKNYTTGELKFVATSENKVLMDIINLAMENITFSELSFLRKHFFSNVSLRQNNINIELTQEEKFYLMNKQILNACTKINDAPFGSLFKNEYIGIGEQILQILEKDLDIPIEVISNTKNSINNEKLLNNECDFINLSNDDTQYEQIKNSDLLFEAPIVVITNTKSMYFSNFKEKLNETFLIKSDNPIQKKLKELYPEVELIQIDDEIEALKLIEQDLHYGLITSLYAVSTLFQNNLPDKLKISGQLEQKIPYRFSVLNSNEMLISILNKAINQSIKPKIAEIIKQEVKDTYPQGFDHSIVLLLVVVFIIFFIIMSKQHLKLLLQKEALGKLNENLELRVKQETDANREKDVLMYRQNRFASMGEMLSNIAHQWRQPLMELSSLLMSLRASVFFDQKISNNEILEVTHKSDKVIQFMSNTINDFRNFLDTNKEQENFKASEVIQDLLHVMQFSLNKNNIKLNITQKDENLEIFGIKNEYLQVVINIVSNAQDILVSKKIENPNINLLINQIGSYIVVEIFDNGGGIKEENVNIVFEPFYTKGKTNGTGIGLFMSKIIIENNMQGKLEVNNTNEGAKFIITTQKAKEQNENK